MTGIYIVLLSAALLLAAAGWRQKKKLYQAADQMLEQILKREPIEQPDMQEGQRSALASKMIRVQEALACEVDRAEQEKEQVKSLISNMSHQLKTPLSSVMMYQELLEGSLEAEQRAGFLAKMKLQLDRIDWILQSLFQMVRLEQGAIQFDAGRASLKETLAAAVSAVYGKAEKKEITIATEPFTDCFLWHNPKWTAEVFVNLLENAIKYSAAGSQIEISVHPLELFTEVRFQDHGIGIRKEELTRVFRRFYRSKDVENQEGTGIGLYLSRLILDKEKAYMTAASEYGKGCCISVFLQNC
ncbi:MAG: HAMP domain-containing histidine kinase [Lachnospiraceae bacterium]|nr:HAMP domain-containing histidine kinase [Lachnospiraceae bacterium]